MEIDLTSVFPTLIGSTYIPDARSINEDLRALILEDEAKHLSAGHSGSGVWHSQTEFLNGSEPAVDSLTTWITWAVGQMVNATAGPGTFRGMLSVSAWAAVCRAGAYHAPHSHPDSAWSGVYYVEAGPESPDHPLSGVLEFLDPRAGAEAVSAPGDPYAEAFRVYPRTGLLVVFPSWLYHWVHPYVGEMPRIAISFNVTCRAFGLVKGGGTEYRAREETPRFVTNGVPTAVT